jgi:hypothetical protein
MTKSLGRISLGGALALASGTMVVAGPLAQSGAAIGKAAEDIGAVQLVHECHRVCERGPVEEWGGAVRWHRHVGRICRPVRCSPR